MDKEEPILRAPYIHMAAGHRFRLTFDLSHDGTPTVFQIPSIEFTLENEAITARAGVEFA